MIQLSTLGTLDLRRSDGTVVHSVLQQPKRAALLIYLAMSDGVYQRRDTLLALFWPESGESSARHSLSQAVYKLREAIGAESITARGDEEVKLAPGVISCDALSFRNAAREGRHADALELYRGDFLSAFHVDGLREFARWADADRSELREIAATSAWALAREQLSRRATTEAYRTAARAFELAPANEASARSFIGELVAAGDAAAALSLYHHVERVLAEELETVPAKETQAIADSLRLGARSEAVTPQVAPRTLPAPRSVGNETYAGAEQTLRPHTTLGRSRLRISLAAAITAVGAVAAIGWAVKDVRSATPTVATVAVLPLDNLARDSSQDYFADGMYNALIGELGQVSALRVVPRGATMRYGSATPVADIAQDLHVDAVVRGGVMRFGDSVRVIVHLIGIQPQRELWSASYRRSLRDVPSIHAEIARAIATEVEVRLTPRDVRRASHVPTVDPAAYDAWLQGSFYARRRSGTDLSQCFHYARQAVAADPNYAPGYELLAECYNVATFVNSSEPSDMFEGAKRAARRAISLDESLAPAYSDLGYAQAHYDWDWTAAEASYRHALRLNPSLETTEEDLAWLLSWSGRYDEALQHAHRAEQLDPNSPQAALRVGMILTFARRYDEAIGEARRAIGLDSTYMFAYDRLHWAYYGKGEPALALAAAQRAVALSGPGDIRRRAFLAHAYANNGQPREAQTILDEILKLQGEVYVSPGSVAIMYMALGHKEQALDWLERGFDGKDGDMVLLKVFGVWDPLRNEPRFKAILARMRFPE